MENEQKPVEETPKMRQIIIETDGTKISIPKNETVGLLELKAVLTEILTQLR